jgi:hypothetical protein
MIVTTPAQEIRTMGIAHGCSTVKHAQRSLDLNGKVHVSRGVDQVDAVLSPGQRRRSRNDSDSALSLLLD